MSRTRTLVLTASLLAAVGAAPALAAPECDGTAGRTVHTVEETGAGTPAGGVTTPVLHSTVEPTACRRP